MSENCRVLTKEQYDELFRRINELEKNLAGAEQSVQEGMEINEELKADNKKLKEKLNIAVKALEKYADHSMWKQELDEEGTLTWCASSFLEYDDGWRFAQEALEQIKEVK